MLIWKALFATALITFGVGILGISILKSAAVHYSFSGIPEESWKIDTGEKIDYDLPYSGRILPDSPFWFIKVARDKAWTLFTSKKSRKAELNLLFADKRLVASKLLFEKGEYELGAEILLKAELYLQEASNLREGCKASGENTREFLKVITLASLKHREVIDEIVAIAPEDARPEIIKIKDITREVFIKERNALQEIGEVAPKSPSEWD